MQVLKVRMRIEVTRFPKLRRAISISGGNFKFGGQFRNQYAISKFSNCAKLQIAWNIYTANIGPCRFIAHMHNNKCILLDYTKRRTKEIVDRLQYIQCHTNMRRFNFYSYSFFNNGSVYAYNCYFLLTEREPRLQQQLDRWHCDGRLYLVMTVHLSCTL